ncbi:MAG: hypothetical protein R3Y63_09810 [Eubacteriales bacterium]
MYYFYNQFLESILTAERWASAQDLQSRPYSFLTCPDLDKGKEVLRSLKSTFDKEQIRHIILLKEERAKKPAKWPTALENPQGDESKIVEIHSGIVAYLLQTQGTFVQLRESSALFSLPNHNNASPPVVVEDVRIFDQVLKNVTVEVLPLVTEVPEEREPLNFESVHSQFNAQKKSSQVIRQEDGILLKGSLRFHDYQLALDIVQISQLLSDVFENIEEIALHYGGLLRDVDAQIEDQLHFIEFFDLDANRCVTAYKRLQELRVKRRCIKDSMQLADLLVKQLGNDFPQRLHHISKKITHWDERTYAVRVPDEFQY